MIILNRSYEEKKATLILDIFTGNTMTKEEAFEHYGNHLCEGIVRLSLLNTYKQSKYSDIGILEYDTEEFYTEALNQEQKSTLWHALVVVEFIAYHNHSPFNNGDNNDE